MSTDDDRWVFGKHAVAALIKQRPECIQTLYIQQGLRDCSIESLAKAAHMNYQLVSRSELDQKISGCHQGVVASIHQSQKLRDNDLIVLLKHCEQPFLLILDGVTDPHNLGACLRTAAAAGVDAVIVPKNHAAPLNATVRKVACGAADMVPLVKVTNLARTMKSLQQQGIWLYGAEPEAKKLFYDINLRGALGLVIGAEGRGIRHLTRQHCDDLAKLPMAGPVESLNVSVAAGICLFEAVRQRL